MASIEERAGSWRVYWRMGGRAGRKQSTTFPTEPQALAAKALVASRHHHVSDAEVYRAILGLDGDGGRAALAPTLTEHRKAWIAHRRTVKDIQPDVLDDYERMIERRIEPYLGHLRLPQITDDVRNEWIAWLVAQTSARGRPFSPRSVRLTHSILHMLVGAAVPKWLPANPIAKPTGSRKRISGLPKSVRYDAVFLLPQEIGLLGDACGPAIEGMYYVAVRTGLRLGEQLVLRVGDDVVLTGSRKKIKVRRALKADGSIGAPKSERSNRDVSISSDVAERMAALAKNKRRGDLFFTTPRGKMWPESRLRQRYWLPAVGAARRCPQHLPSLPSKGKTGPARHPLPDEVSTCDCPTRLHQVPRWHDLRHTHVSLCVEAGWDPVRVQRRVGHNSIKTTMDIYGHLWEPHNDDRLDAIERLLVIADDEAA